MTAAQLQWVRTMKEIRYVKATKLLRPPSNVLRAYLYHLVLAEFFDGVITAVVIVNIAAMAADYWGIGVLLTATCTLTLRHDQ